MINEMAASTTESLVEHGVPYSTLVTEKVAESFKASGYRTLTAVACHFHEGVVVLRGRVPSFYMKQLAQVLAGRVPGVDVVANRLRVDSVTDDR